MPARHHRHRAQARTGRPASPLPPAGQVTALLSPDVPCLKGLHLANATPGKRLPGVRADYRADGGAAECGIASWKTGYRVAAGGGAAACGLVVSGSRAAGDPGWVLRRRIRAPGLPRRRTDRNVLPKKESKR